MPQSLRSRRLALASFARGPVGVVAGSISLSVSPAALAGVTTSPRITAVSPAPQLGVADQIGLATLVVTFDETVTVPAGAVVAWTVGGGPAAFSSSYDLGANTLTLTFTPPIVQDRATIVLDYSIADLSGNALDGEVLDPAKPFFPTGNGQRGGPAVFRINVLQGDANRDGVVNAGDGQAIAAALGTCSGDPTFDSKLDLNRDGCVNAIDVAIWQQGLGGVLPPTDGVAPTIDARTPELNASVRAKWLTTASVTFPEAVASMHIEPRSLFALDPDGVVQPANAVSLSTDSESGATTATFTFQPALSATGVHRLQLSNAVADPSGELLSPSSVRTWNATLDNGPTPIAQASPFSGEQDVALTRESIVFFKHPVADQGIDSQHFFATFANEVLPALVKRSSDGHKVTLFYRDDLPASALVRVTVIGDGLKDDLGFAPDVDNDGEPGGTTFIDFQTVTLTTLPNTAICGRVFASELGTTPEGEPINVPLEGATITVDGAETTLFAITDKTGNFRLEPAPVGTFFVHVDGRTATIGVPEGAYYPFVGKAWTSIAGQEVNVGNIYLPLVPADALSAVSNTQETVVPFPPSVLSRFPEFAGVQVTVPAGSLYANNGVAGGKVGIAPVPPDRLPGELPPELNFPLVITVQTAPAQDGGMAPENFDVPVPVKFPNLPDPKTGKALPPGSKSALWSFDHDKGRFEVVGPMTVSDDGQFVVTDAGYGIIAPGWHGTQPGTNASGGGGSCSATRQDADRSCGAVATLMNAKGIITASAGVVGAVLVIAAAPKVAAAFGLSVALHILVFEIVDYANNSATIRDSSETTPETTLALILAASLPIFEELQGTLIAIQQNGQVSDADVSALQDAVLQLDGVAGGSFVATMMQLDEMISPNAIEVEVEEPVHSLSLLVQNDFSSNLRAHTLTNGDYQVVLGSWTTGSVLVFDSIQWAVGVAFLPAYPGDGIPTAVQPYVLTSADGLLDSDRDGLPNLAELAVGTDITMMDTDSDGIPDGAEVQQGTNPLDGLVVQTGIVATANTPGTAKDVCAVNNLALVADGSKGVSVFNVFNGMNPTIIAQVDTPGDALAVACSGDGNFVAIADGAKGLAIVDFSDPPAASVTYQIEPVNLGGAAQCVVAAGGIAYVGTTLGTVSAVDQATGSVLEQIVLGGGVQDVAIEGSTLFAITDTMLFSLRLLQGPLAVADSVSAPGNATSTTGRRRLFVGGGIAYVTSDKGYSTFNVADPANVSLIAIGNTTQFGWFQVVANGSGLGCAAAGPNGSPDGPHNVSLYDLSNPQQNSVFLTEFTTPGVARALSIFNGKAYVADSESGLQVINFLPYDAQGQPPSVSFAMSYEAGGNEVVEGTLVLVTATVSDDVQVRNVELLLNGQVAQTDGNFPFQFFFAVPSRAGGGDRETVALAVEVRASDTGGNKTVAAAQSLQVVPDSFPPTVVATSPDAGAEVASGLLAVQAMFVRFSESVDPATVTEDAVSFIGTGADGLFGTRDDVVHPTQISLVDQDRRLVVDAPTPPIGMAKLTVSGAMVKDLAGNLLDGDGDGQPGGNFVLVFAVLDLPANKFWIAPASGSWHVASNWSGGTIPGPTDFVLIDRPEGDLTITISQGAPVCAQLICNEKLTVSGGTLTAVGTIQVNNEFLLDGGTIANTTLVQGTGGQALACTSNTNNKLSGVTVDGDLHMSAQSSSLRIAGTMSFGGTVHLSGSDARVLSEPGTSTTIESGTIAFEGTTGNERHLGFVGGGASNVLTLGASVVVKGGKGTVGQRLIDSGGATSVVSEGTIEADMPGQTITVSSSLGTFANAGTARASRGSTLSIAAVNWTSAGAIATEGGTVNLTGTLAGGATIAVVGGAANVGGALSGSTTIENDGGTVNLTGIVNNAGSTLALVGTGVWNFAGATLEGGTVNQSKGAALTFSASSNNIFDGVTVVGDLLLSSSQASLRIRNGLNISGQVAMSGGSSRLWYEGEQTWTAGTIVCSGAGQKHVGASWSGTATLTLGQGITLEGGGWTVGAPLSGTPATIVNEGLLKSTVEFVFGNVLAQSFVNSGTMRVESGARINVTSTSWVNGGLIEVKPEALLTCASINQSDAGTVTSTVAGLGFNQFGRITCSGTATLAGTLGVELVGGFVPTVGNAFDVLTYGSHTGQFSSYDGFDVAPGVVLQPNYLPTKLQLQAVAGRLAAR